ncbi:MAG: ferritin-like domain-containing protein [Polyangiaceae bacterium]
MSEPFTIEWLGGPAEFYFRKARPEGDFDWASLEPARYPPTLVAAAQDVWMGIVLAEYAAIAAFADVVGALTQARAPLDLIGMTGDFLADEVRHVELASRVVMQLGGAPARAFDTTRLSPATPSARTALQRANELALRIGCIAEVFASATAVPIMRETTHPLLRSVYESILRDEARHRRFGSLYFEWACDRLDAAERARLGLVTLDALQIYAPLWRRAQALADTRPEWQGFEVHELGWMEPSRYVPLARAVVRDEILAPLRELGLILPELELETLLA